MKASSVGLFLLMVLGFCQAATISQSINEEGLMSIEVQISKSYDANIIKLEEVCTRFPGSSFSRSFKNAQCQDAGTMIVISGKRYIDDTEGFSSRFDLMDTVYSFNSSDVFFSGLIPANSTSLCWGAVPLKVSTDSLSYQGIFVHYLVEMPGEISKVRNGEIMTNKAKFNLVDLFVKKRGVYVESKETNWKFFSSLIIFLVMIVGILVVWMSYFYLKSKT